MTILSNAFSRLAGGENLWSYNWVFLVCWLVIIITIIFCVYYINRLFAYVFKKVVNFFLYSVYHVVVDIESLDVSLLFGTIHVKNLVVITNDSTISIVRGTFQWKFWMLRAWLSNTADYNNNFDSEKQDNKRSFYSDDVNKIINSTNNFFDIEGLEIFLYNNTGGYKHIFEHVLTERDRELLKERYPAIEEIFGSTEQIKEAKSSQNFKKEKIETVYNVSLIDQLLDSFLPFLINVKKGSVVIGTPSTKYLLVMNWLNSQTLLHGIKSENSLDLYQLRLNTTHEKFLLSMEPNPLYKSSETLVTTGFSNFFLRNSKMLIHFINRKARKFAKHKNRNWGKHDMLETSKEWKGLSMYINLLDPKVSTSPAQKDASFKSTSDSIPYVEEYAKYSKLIECDLLSHVYCFDIPGYVPTLTFPTSTDYQGPEVGNGGSAPDMRLDIQLSNAQISIGPWAYRNLMPILSAMLPTHSRDIDVFQLLKPGDRRIATRFRLFIDIQYDCNVRIPTREPSKDENFFAENEKIRASQAENNLESSIPLNAKVIRPYGWFDVDIKEGSSMFFDFNFYPINSKSINSYSFELVEPVITTSVNHEICFSADFHSFIWEQSFPLLKKDTGHNIISQLTNNSRCNLLREHITLLTDLVQDFSILDEALSLDDQYQNFCPSIYKFDWRFKDGYNLITPTNDANIINLGAASSENNYISFVGDSSEVEITIPMEIFYANSTTVDFKLTTKFFDVMLTTPAYSTLKNFADGGKIGRGRELEIIGYYEFFNEISFGNVDNLNLEFNGDQLNLLFYGFVIKYFTNLYENLIGETINFKTAEEYQEELFQNSDHLSAIFTNSSNYANSAKVSSKNKNDDLIDTDSDTIADSEFFGSKKSNSDDENSSVTLTKDDLKRKENDLDVFVKFNIRNSNLLFPEGITNPKKCIGLHTQDMNIDIRALDYYFDLQIDAQPIYIKKNELFDNLTSDFFLNYNFFHKPNFEECEGMLTYLSCHNHRFFGPFPIDETYLTKWDFSFGSLNLDTDLSFLKKLVRTVTNFDFTLDDMENMLVMDKIESFGIEFDSFEIEEICITLNKESLLTKILLTDIVFYYNEFENGRASTTANLEVDTIVLECLRNSERILKLETNVKLEKTFTYANSKKRMHNQKILLIKNDSPFHRIWSLLPVEFRNYYVYQNSVGFVKAPQSLPTLPLPLINQTVDLMVEEYLNDEDYKNVSFLENKMHLRKNIMTLEALDLNLFKKQETTATSSKHKKLEEISFGTILVDLDVANIDFITIFLEEISKTDCEAILDTVYTDIIKGLFLQGKAQGSEKFSNIAFNGVELKVFNSLFSPTKFIKLYAPALNMNCDIDTRYELQKNSIISKVSKSMKLVSKKISLTVHHTEEYDFSRQESMRVVLESLNYELKNDGSNSVKTFNFGTVNNHLNPVEFEIVTEMVLKSLPLIDETIVKAQKIVSNIQNRERELVLQLLIAGNQFDINYDPPEVSKLATIVRLSKSHVRENRSWRICGRLKHIFNNLPEHWTELFMEKIENNNFTPFEIASSQFFNCFNKWSNIEKQITESTYIFRDLFLKANTGYQVKPGFEESVEIAFKSFFLKISDYEDESQDSFILKNVKFNLHGANLGNLNFSTDVGALYGRLGTASLNFWILQNDLLNTKSGNNFVDSSVDVSKDSSDETILDSIDASFSLQKMKLDLCLDDNVFEITNHNTKLNFSKSASELINLDWQTGLGNLSLRHKSLSLFGTSVSDLQVLYSNKISKDLNQIIHNITTNLSSVSVINSEDSVKSIFVIESAWRSITRYKHEFSRKVPKSPSGNKNKEIETIAIKTQNLFNFSSFIKSLSFSTNILLPLVCDSKVDNVKLTANNLDKVMLEIAVPFFSVDISSSKTSKHYMLFTQNNFNVVTHFDNLETDLPVVINVDFAINMMKFMISDIRAAGTTIVEDLCSVEETLYFIKNKLVFYGLVGAENENENEILFNTAFDIGYLEALIDFSSQQLLAESMKTTFGLKNFETIDRIPKMLENSLWYYGINSFSVSLNDQQVAQEQSKFLDFSLAGYVLKSADNQLLDLILESKFVSVMLTPLALVKLLWFFNQFEIFGNAFAKKRLIDTNSADTKLVSANTEAHEFTFFKFFNKIQFVSTNLSIGWIYSDQGNNENNWQESGVVYGYEKLILKHSAKNGGMKLENLFFGATPFSKADLFHKIIRKRNYINFMSLPLLSVSYILTESSETQSADLNVDVFGDVLQIFLCENLILMVKNIMNSVLEFKKLENRYISKHTVARKMPSNKKNFLENEVFELLGFHNIKCKIDYAGGYCSILSHKDFLNSSKPTIALHSPKVTMDIVYQLLSKSVKLHRLSMLTKISDSENLLYPTSVPIFNKLVKDFGDLNSLMEKSLWDQSTTILQSPIFQEESEQTKDNLFNFKDFLNKFDLYFKVECGSQELALTCEPKAKVEAVLGVEKMIFTAETAIIDAINSITIFFDSEKLSSKFHHIFSNTISSYFQLSKFSMYGFLSSEFEIKEENFSVITANSLDSHIDITQLQEVNLFFDIWTSKSSLTTFTKENDSLQERENINLHTAPDIGELHETSLFSPSVFKKSYSENTFAVSVMFVLKDVKCIIDLGPDLGCLTLTGTKLWFDFSQSSNWSKQLVLNVADIVLSSVGRLQSLIELKNFTFDTKVLFSAKTPNDVLNYNVLDFIPYMELCVSMESLKTSFSLDYHSFLLTEFADWKIKISNEIVDGAPNLTTFIDLDKIEIYATALVTANLLSIYDSLEKIKVENLKSYYDILHDSNTVTNKSIQIKQGIQIYLNSLNKALNVRIGDIYAQVSPHSLVYPQVLILENKNTIINFRGYGSEKIFADVEISTEKLLGRVTKSALISLSEDDLKDISISEYQQLAKNSTGGTIVNFPSISTKMSTWKTSDSNVIEFIYNSTFGGLVNIKWNLGPIGFIKNIWTIHAVGLKQINDSRVEITHKAEKNKKTSFFEVENLDERIKKVKLNDKYEYKPLVVPIIDTPNLKDLGNATPPLKWFGINKEKFPGMIYETISEPLQEIFDQLQKEYGKALNKL